MPRKVSYSIVAQDLYSKVAEKVTRSTSKMRKGFRKFSKDLKEIEIDFKKVGRAMKGFGKKMSYASAAVMGFLGLAVTASGKNEALASSFNVLTGSAEKGGALLKDLYTFAAKTPFEISELGDAARQLLAMGIETENVISKMDKLGNMAAATKRPINEFALVYGQIMSTGFLTGGDAMQLTNKGIGIRGMIAERLGVSVSDVYDLISKRLIPAKMVDDILTDLVSEGGRFEGMMEKTSRTLPGIWSNTKDLISQSLTAIGDIVVEQFDLKNVLIKVNEKLEYFLGNIKRIAEENPRLVRLAAVFTTLFVVLGPIIAAIGSIVVGYGAMAAMAALASTTIAALVGVGLVVGGVILGVIAAIGFLIYYWDEFVAAFRVAWAYISSAVDSFTSKGIIGAIRGTLEWSGILDTNMFSSSTVDVNLNDPGGAVESVDYSSDGPMDLNLGSNMAGAK